MGAELWLIPLYFSAAGAGRAHVPSCSSKPASAPGAAPGICSVCWLSSSRNAPSSAGTDLCHLGTAPFSCFYVVGHKAAFMDMLINVSDVIPDPQILWERLGL